MEGAVAKWGRERCDSAGDSMEEHTKRKREMLGKDVMERERGEAEIFKRSKRIVRSPERKEGSVELKGMLKEMREEVREGLRGMRQEIKEAAEGQKEAMRMEIERMKEGLERREERWNREREEMKGKIERMERELEGLKVGRAGNGGAIGGEGERKDSRGNKEERGEREWKERIRKLERRWEQKDRGERKRNFIMKGVKEGERGLKEEVEEVIRRLGVEVRVEDIRRVEAGRMDKGSMVIVKVGSEEEKKVIMRNKWRLRGERIWIEEDLTWEERRVRWRMIQVARKEEEEGRRVKIGQGRVWIEGTCWVWDEEREDLRDGRGRYWKERERGEGAKEEEGGGRSRVERYRGRGKKREWGKEWWKSEGGGGGEGGRRQEAERVGGKD